MHLRCFCFFWFTFCQGLCSLRAVPDHSGWDWNKRWMKAESRIDRDTNYLFFGGGSHFPRFLPTSKLPRRDGVLIHLEGFNKEKLPWCLTAHLYSHTDWHCQILIPGITEILWRIWCFVTAVRFSANVSLGMASLVGLASFCCQMKYIQCSSYWRQLMIVNMTSVATVDWVTYGIFNFSTQDA